MHGGGLELTLVFLLAAVVAVPVFKRFGLGAVLAYLVAGVVLGPYELRAVRNPEPVLAAAEVGVVMLLFVIGLELSPSRLTVMRRTAPTSSISRGDADMDDPFREEKEGWPGAWNSRGGAGSDGRRQWQLSHAAVILARQVGVL